MSRYRRSISPLLLACLLVWGVLTLWMRERWPRSVLEIGLFALAAGSLLLGRPRWDWKLVPLAFAAVWPVLQILCGWTVYRHATLDAALFWTAAAAGYVAASDVLRDPGDAAVFRRGMAGFGIGLAALATVQLYTSRGRVFWLFDSGYSDSVLGPFVYRNNYAAFMELLLPLALVEAFENRHGGWFLAGSALMVASVIASGSRAGAVLVSVELLAVGAIWIYRCRGGRSSTASLLRLALLIVVLTAVGGWGLLWDRFQEKEPLELRRQYLEASLAMFRDRPWTGFGLGTWPNVYPAYAAVDNGMFANRAHNDWAEWASEGGVPFVVALILVAGGAVGRAFRSVWGIGLVSVCVHALVDYPFARLGQVAWWFTVLALVGSLPRQHHSDGADQDVQVDPE